MLEKLESLVKVIVEIGERAQELSISKEEYAVLNVIKKYLSNRSDSDRPHSSRSWIERSRRCSSPDWWRKIKMSTGIEQTLFDTCFQKFAGDLDTKQLTSLREELMIFIIRR